MSARHTHSHVGVMPSTGVKGICEGVLRPAASYRCRRPLYAKAYNWTI